MMKTKLKSFLVLLAMMVLVPQGVKARELGPWNIWALADACGNNDIYGGDNGEGAVPLSSNSYSGITNGYYGLNNTTIGSVTIDLSRFAFRSARDRGWYLYKIDNNQCGLFIGNGTPEFAITGLKPDDVVKVTFRGRGTTTTSITFVSGSAKSTGGNTLNANDIIATSNGGTETVAEFTASAKGNVVISTNGGKYSTFITYISIERSDVASYNYDPAKEVYDLTQVTNGDLASNNFAAADFQLNNTTAQYLTNLSGGLAANNRIAVTGTDSWTFDGGLKNNTDWTVLNLSIANLKADDRVRITYQNGNGNYGGNQLNFGSDANNGSSLLNSSAFKDDNNNGELDTDEDEHMITRDEAVDGSVFYTMTEDGHLDLVVFPGVKITKIEIVSDHQAVMLDRYNGSVTTGHTSYFSSTGQLMAKEHIVPGGLEVHIGNENTTQHAIVVSSDKGPVSFVYDHEHKKMARHATYGSFDVMSELPVSGTYYKFIPEVSGSMTVRLKANSINYRNYNIQGNEAVDQNGTPNEVTNTAQCPYYLMVANGNQPQVVTSKTKGNGADITFDNQQVEAGKVYYIYGWWDNIEDAFNITSHAAGVAELIDVTFIPDKKVSPLAKWVDNARWINNNSTYVEELADVTGFTTSDIHIKKMSASITGCNASIESGKLKITNITFAEGANPGGTILIKLGDPSNDANPVFAYTIAYDASFNMPEGADRSEGHTWNFSDNPLKGLEWTNTSSEASVVDFSTESDVNGLLYKEMHDGSSDWTKTWRVINSAGEGTHDPMFLNKHGMEGNNADMMWDTEGLIINTSSNQSCINNEHGSVIDHTIKNQPDPDRYIGILPGGEFIIPQLKKDDRVIIYMGSGNGSGSQTMHFSITNARDAVYNEIYETDDYYAGGSKWNVPDGHNDPYYRGCYHFFAKENGDMKFTLEGGSMCKLYSIQIYHGERIGTNGIQEVANGGYTLLATEGETGQTKSWNLHYRGKGESLANGSGRYTEVNEVIANSTSIENPAISTDGNSISFTNPGAIGMIRVRAKCMEYNHNYVTDFADRNLTLAYHQKADQYPYTWDFTDIKGFSNTAITAEKNNYNELGQGDAGYGYEPKGRELSLWDENSAMVIYCTDGDYYTNQNMIFENAKGINGNQLYANGGVIPETKGLWFYFDNNDAAYNGSMKIAADGLHLANASYENGATCDEGVSMRRGWWNYKMVVPDVPAGAAVYLRMARDMSVREGDVTFRPWSPTNNTFVDVTEPFFYKKFQFEWMSTKAEIGAEQTEICKYYQASDGTGDYIVAIKNSGETSNLTFTLNGWILKKMSVATDEKTVNKFGWNTESRDHAIDPSLMSYMTGKDFRAYVVTEADVEKNTVTLVRIDGGSVVDAYDEIENSNTVNPDSEKQTDKFYVPAAVVNPNDNPVVPKNGSINACIIRYVDETKEENDQQFGIFERTVVKNGQPETEKFFHLFVPDMHDKGEAEAVDLTGNLLKARVTKTTTGDNVPHDEKVTVEENGEQKNYIYNNYAFTSRHKNVVMGGQWMDGPQAFYRIVSGGAGSDGNQAYLSIKASGTSTSRSAEPSNSSVDDHYDIVFKDWKDLEAERGDVNGDGVVTQPDVELLKDYVTVRYSNGLFKRMGDMNDDGRVDIVDMTLLIKKIMSE